MDYRLLVEEVTRLVIEELERSNGQAANNSNPDAPAVLILIDPEAREFKDLFDVLLKAPSRYNYTIVTSTANAERIKSHAAGLRINIIADPDRSSYTQLMQKCVNILIPHISVTSLMKMSNLIGDEYLPGIFIEGLLSGKPVTVCPDYIHSLKFSDTGRPQRVLALVRSGLAALEELGVKTSELKCIAAELNEEIKESVKTTASFKNVITNEDIMIASNQVIKDLNFPRGTIITPLARETATALGIRINLA